MHNLKVENYGLFGEISGDLTWKTASQIALRDCSKEVREEPGYIVLQQKPDSRGFPGGAVVESLPANAGDTGSSPGLGGSHMPRSN